MTERTAAAEGLALCLSCHRVVPCAADQYTHCPRCGAFISQRKLASRERCIYFLLLATLLLIPANTLPMMNILMFNRGDPSTILGGVILLAKHHQYGIAAIVFIASFVVPPAKIIGLSVLLHTINNPKSLTTARARTKLYRLVEFLGRWSMLDVFVVAILVGAVQLGQVASIVPGAGAMAFGASVVFTMMASMSFDPRLIWDNTHYSRPER